MGDAWTARKTLKRLRARPRLLVCNALLDQTLFAGSGRKRQKSPTIVRLSETACCLQSGEAEPLACRTAAVGLSQTAAVGITTRV